jgi:hypothetical protein
LRDAKGLPTRQLFNYLFFPQLTKIAIGMNRAISFEVRNLLFFACPWVAAKLIRRGASLPMHTINTFPSSKPRIILGSDTDSTQFATHEALAKAGFSVDLASGYDNLEELWQKQRHDVVLLEVSYAVSVDRAVELALRLKRQDSRQFVGYLADPILQTSGLAGDALFPRDCKRLADALRRFFGPQAQ